MARNNSSFKYKIKSSQGIVNLSRAIINQALNDLPESKSFFISKLFNQIVKDIDVDPDKLLDKFNLVKEPKWISNLERRLIINDSLPECDSSYGYQWKHSLKHNYNGYSTL